MGMQKHERSKACLMLSRWPATEVLSSFPAAARRFTSTSSFLISVWYFPWSAFPCLTLCTTALKVKAYPHPHGKMDPLTMREFNTDLAQVGSLALEDLRHGMLESRHRLTLFHTLYFL